ncbi:MAG: hypothetical protein WED04_09180 [Promethearchaeati archaeon SRVP18_Atabeyarchaeia-1]
MPVESREIRIVIPPEINELFAKQPHMIFKTHPIPGLWPVTLEILKNIEALKKLAASKEFNEKYDIVIIPK